MDRSLLVGWLHASWSLIFLWRITHCSPMQSSSAHQLLAYFACLLWRTSREQPSIASSFPRANKLYTYVLAIKKNYPHESHLARNYIWSDNMCIFTIMRASTSCLTRSFYAFSADGSTFQTHVYRLVQFSTSCAREWLVKLLPQNPQLLQPAQLG